MRTTTKKPVRTTSEFPISRVINGLHPGAALELPAANIERMAYIGKGFPLDIAAQRASGPENRRTTGGMAYRVSRTNTPDLQELRRDIDREREAAKAQGRKGSAHVEHRHGHADEHACWHDLMHHFLHISPVCFTPCVPPFRAAPQTASTTASAIGAI